jgi:hypothetical protein
MGKVVSMDEFATRRAKKDADLLKGEQKVLIEVERTLARYNLRDLRDWGNIPVLHLVTKLNARLKRLGSPRRLRLRLSWTMDEPGAWRRDGEQDIQMQTPP